MTRDEHDDGPATLDLLPLEEELRGRLGDALDRRRILRWLALAGGSGAAMVTGLHSVLRADPRLAGLSRRTLAWAAERCAVTGSDVEGPFYLAGAPRRAMLAGADEPGDRLTIGGRVLLSDCTSPIGGALVDVWQADAEGRYHGPDERFRLRGRIVADERGSYQFETIVPGRYRIEEASSFRPAHIHFKVSGANAPTLTTQLYFKGDPYLGPKDACQGQCRSDDPGRIIELGRKGGAGALLAGAFDIVLAGHEA